MIRKGLAKPALGPATASFRGVGDPERFVHYHKSLSA